MHSPTTKIAVLGAGSIGCYIGGLLASQGVDVTFIGREALKTVLKDKGLTLTHFTAEPVHIPHNDMTISTSADSLAGCSVIFLCTKSQDTRIAAEQIKQQAHKDVTLISCQNGVTNVPLLKEALGPEFKNIMGSIIPYNVTPTGPGTYHCGTGGTLHFEANIPQDLEQAFQAAGQDILIGGNFEGDQWAKLLINLNNGLNTLSGTTLRRCLGQKAYRQALRLCLLEAKQIVEQSGITLGRFNGRSPELLLKTLALPNWAYRLIMQYIVKIDGKARSSMLDDLELGRSTEIDALQGQIVSLAKTYGMKAPYNARVLKAVKQAFDKGGSPNYSGQEILSLIENNK